MKVDTNIENSNNALCDCINEIELIGRGRSSVNILNCIRNLLDAIIVKIKNSGDNVDMTNEEIKQSLKYIKENAKYRDIRDFHDLLGVSSSHFTNDEFGSETMTIKYLEYLYRLRTLAKDNFNQNILHNLEKYPDNLDELSKNYYGQIAKKFDSLNSAETNNGIYYIIKKKTIILKGGIFYEITFTGGNNKNNKSDRFIGFTNINIFDNYAVKLFFTKGFIEVFGKKVQVLIIKTYDVSIRPAELQHFAKIFGYDDLKIKRGDINYNRIVNYIKEYGLNLVDIILNDYHYNNLKSSFRADLQSGVIIKVFEDIRKFIINNKEGSNVVRYLLFNLNYRIVKDQYSGEKCNLLSYLYLSIYSKPFDNIPFTFSLIGHNPRQIDLFKSINFQGREDELLARYIKNNAEANGQLYTKISEVEEKFNDIDSLISTYYDKLYRTHKGECVEKSGKYIYIKSYENNVMDIIKKFDELSGEGLQNYSNFVEKRLDELNLFFDDFNKKEIIKKLFLDSKIALIYGSAGTGKTRLLEYISGIFSGYNKLYITQTLTALDNLDRRVKYDKTEFVTVKKATMYNYECDLLFIDESSTISNRDMQKILYSGKIKYDYLIAVGDIYQIESIQFGNWFGIAEKIFPKFAYHLNDTHRTKDDNLLKLWEKTRELDDKLIEYISQGYGTELSDDIFKKYSDDEIILCLNYDGIYGVNSINNYMQINNTNDGLEFRDKLYKIGDPIVFNDLANDRDRFGNTIYNNLKGNIVDIIDEGDYIYFHIGLFIPLTSLDVRGTIDLVDLEDSNFDSIIKFPVYRKKQTVGEDDDEDVSEMHIVPFDIAYAMSIHKAQGLEYKSVKIVITDEIEERVTHNIFYTAITRAKEELKIYSSPEVLNNIISRMTLNNSQNDSDILKSKLENDSTI